MREKNESLPLRNRLREVRTAQGLSQSQLADMVGVSRNTISSIETGQFSPTAKLALLPETKTLRAGSEVRGFVLF